MFEVKNTTEDMSDLEYLGEFMAQYPDEAALITSDKFPVFYQYPRETIDHFNAAIKFMINLQIPEDVIKQELEFHINQACEEVVNLKAKEAENEQ